MKESHPGVRIVEKSYKEMAAISIQAVLIIKEEGYRFQASDFVQFYNQNYGSMYYRVIMVQKKEDGWTTMQVVRLSNIEKFKLIGSL